MLKYIIIPLASDAVSFCHYNISAIQHDWIPENILRKSIVWAMKSNASVQFIYPTSSIPAEIENIVNTIDYTSIVPYNHSNEKQIEKADIIVFDKISDLVNSKLIKNKACLVHVSLDELNKSITLVHKALSIVSRLNFVISDISELKSADINNYELFLANLIPNIVKEYQIGHQVQVNLLTDRLMLKEMNNCNAGYESLTIAPNGKFYICPAFWLDNTQPLGDLEKGIDIKNPQLFKLSHAPICRKCDAWQCKRCVWLNKHLTREVNTPSHQQCVISHIERNASILLLEEFRKIDPMFLSGTEIPEIDYLDPFDKLINNQ